MSNYKDRSLLDNPIKSYNSRRASRFSNVAFSTEPLETVQEKAAEMDINTPAEAHNRNPSNSQSYEKYRKATAIRNLSNAVLSKRYKREEYRKEKISPSHF